MKIQELTKYRAIYDQLVNDRSEYDTEWKQINNYILPGRCVYYGNTKPRKKAFVPSKSVNQEASFDLQVLQSGFHGGLTSPTRKWFDRKWTDTRLGNVSALKQYLEDTVRLTSEAFAASNFYETMHTGYGEFAGYGNICIGIFDDVDPFRAILLTAGEYVVMLDSKGNVDFLCRIMFKTAHQMVDEWGDKVSDSVKTASKHAPSTYFPVLHIVHKAEGYRFPYASIYMEHGNHEKALQRGGYQEMPYFFAPWDVIGSDIYGTGPGTAALPDIKRLQEIEKTFLMASHKDMDPPTNAPSNKRGKVNTLPGGVNYYRNPNEKIEELYRTQFNYEGALKAIDRIEARIGRFFFTDIFLTASRDPNLSPLKAAEVDVREGEKLLRIGPTLERLHTRVLSKILDRVYGILDRKKIFPALPDEYAKLKPAAETVFVSALAKAQRLQETKAISDTLTFAGSVAQIKPDVLDNIDADVAVREYADTVGAPAKMIKPKDAVAEEREVRNQQLAEAKAKEEAMINQQAGMANATAQSEIASNYAGAGVDISTALDNVQ